MKRHAALGGLLPIAQASAARDPIEAALQCLSERGIPQQSGTSPLADCPEVVTALAETGWDALADPAWLETIAHRDLYQLLETVRDHNAFNNPSLTLDTALFDQVLADLPSAQENDEPGFFARLVDGVVATLDRWFPDAMDSVRTWWDSLDLLPEVPASSVEWFVEAAAWALIATLGFIVLYGLARLIARQLANRRRISRDAVPAPAVRELPELSDVAQAPLRERPRLLLRWLLSCIAPRAPRSTHAALTHRQLLQSAFPPLRRHRDGYTDVVMLAEVSTYGTWHADEAAYEHALQAAKRIAEDLEHMDAPVT